MTYGGLDLLQSAALIAGILTIVVGGGIYFLIGGAVGVVWSHLNSRRRL